MKFGGLFIRPPACASNGKQKVETTNERWLQPVYCILDNQQSIQTKENCPNNCEGWDNLANKTVTNSLLISWNHNNVAITMYCSSENFIYISSLQSKNNIDDNNYNNKRSTKSPINHADTVCIDNPTHSAVLYRNPQH